MSEETKGDLGSGKRMDKDLDKTRIQMAILYVWAYVSVLDPTLCLFPEAAATLWQHHG